MTDDGLEHPALVYGSMDAFLAAAVPFVADGLDRSEPVFAAVGADELGALRTRFGRDSSSMTLADTREWHPHTGTRLRAFHEFARARVAPGGRAAFA